MKKKQETVKTLYSWVGIRELHAAMSTHPELKDEIEVYMASNDIVKQDKSKPSSLRLALKAESYDKVILLIDFRTKELLDKAGEFLDHYESCMQQDGKGTVDFRVRPVVLKDSKNFEEVYKRSLEVLEVYKETYRKQERHLLLSSGTSVMCACWVLLGKTTFDGSIFLQEAEDRKSIRKVVIPFDIFAELKTKQEELFSSISPTFDEYIKGNSEAIRHCKLMAAAAAQYDVNVLLLGERGTGKELFARAIHEASLRTGKTLQVINVATLNENNAISELFGHEAGAYTDAKGKRDGAFMAAKDGTLFLDEVGECPLAAQGMLLRALQPPEPEKKGERVKGTTRRFKPLGSDEEVTADVRIIAATNRSIDDEKTGFRADLFDRLGTFIIRIPPLRERKEDIREIAEALLERANDNFSEIRKAAYIRKKFSSNTIKILESYPWPGNVRELGNIIIRAIILSEGKELIEPHALDLPLAKEAMADGEMAELPLASEKPVDLEKQLADMERRYIEAAIRLFPHDASKAADYLGLRHYQTLKYKMKILNIQHDFRKE